MRNDIRREVIQYMKTSERPVRVSEMATELRTKQPKFSEVRESDIRAVVQPMIVTGRLSYAPGLKIKLGHKTK